MDNWLDYLPLAVSLFVFGYLVYLGVSSKQAKPLAQEVAQVAEIAVMAAEEYGRKKLLTTSEDKLRYAAKVFRRWIPAAKGVTDEDMLDAIHAFVPVANAIGVPIEISSDDPLFDEKTGTFIGKPPDTLPEPIGIQKP